LEVEMKSTTLFVFSAAVVFLSLAGCPAAVPLRQRAQPISGTTIGAGGGFGAGSFGNSYFVEYGGPRLVFDRVRTGTGLVTVAHGDGRTSMFFDLGWTSYTWIAGPDSGKTDGLPLMYIGVQHALYTSPGQSCTSILIAGGCPRLVDVALLQDVGPVTGVVGVGSNGALAAIALHVRPARRLQCSVSACGALDPWLAPSSKPYAGSLNLGLEYTVSSSTRWR
jgi:hypothetical protein